MYFEKINKWRATNMLIAEMIDAYRIVPRIVLIGYAWLLYIVVNWFMNLPDPTTQHASLVTIVVGVAGIVIGLYNNSGNDWKNYHFRPWRHKFTENKLEESKLEDG